MDPVNAVNLTQMQTGTVDSLTKGIAPALIEKMQTQCREAIAVLKGSRSAASVNHRVRTLAIVQPARGAVNPDGPGLIYIPGVRSATVTKAGVVVKITHPQKKASIRKLIPGAKSIQVLSY